MEKQNMIPHSCKAVEDLFFSVKSLSHVQLFATPWTAAHQAPWSSTSSQSLLTFKAIKSRV